ncbi:MAG: hypothetical protein ACREJT_13585, partial [Myxococcota bacterium]
EDHHLSAMRIVGALLLAAVCGLAACKPGAKPPSDAVTLYQVDFSAPGNAAGSPPKLADPNTPLGVPRTGPSEIFMGAPMVVDKLCGLTKQPVKLAVASGTQGIEGLFFALDSRYGHYRVELDLCIEHFGVPPLQASEPQVAVFLDMPQAYALGFFEKGRLVIIDQARGVDAIVNPLVIGSYEVGKPIHLTIDVDVTGQTWSVAADGKHLYTGKIGVTVPSAVRVVTRGNPSNVVAIDDVVVWAENDLTVTEPDPLASESTTEESPEAPK